MFFTIKTDGKSPISILKLKILIRARSLISLYPMRGTEILLDSYLIENYKVTLKNLCFLLLTKLYFSPGEENEIIIFFKEDKYAKLAQIITYGVGNLSGSQILKAALST